MASGRGEQAAFDPDDDSGATPPIRSGLGERSESRRRGRGVVTRLFLAGSLASACLFALSALMPCGPGTRPGFLPRMLVDAACARQDVLGQILTLPHRLHAIATVLR